MRRLALALAFSCVAFMFGAGPAMADNGVHVTGKGVLADSCAGCHRIHSAKTAELTKDPQPQLCYTCHGKTGTGATTDVLEGVSRGADGKPTGALRGGGFQFALIDSAHPESISAVTPAAANKVPALTTDVAGTSAVATTSSHSVDGTDQPAWGMGAIGPATTGVSGSVELRCGSCHDPHGNGNYRILRPMPLEGQTSPGTVFPLPVVPVGTPAGIKILDEVNKVYTTTDYWAVAESTTAPNPTTLQPTGFIANISQWCSQCHTRYLATRDSGAEKTPPAPVTSPAQRSRANSGDPDFMFRHTSNGTTSGGKARGCINCHVAHGSNAAMGPVSGTITNPDGNAGVVGDSRLLKVDNRGTCKMCHTEQN